jgi:thiol-disulfide isomerase/thioredoxin
MRNRRSKATWHFRFLLPVALALAPARPAPAQAAEAERRSTRAEQRIVDYLREHVRPGRPLIVSDLYNKVFTTDEERKVLDRLFNTFFKIPLFVAQYRAGTGHNPRLEEIARQFNLPIPGEAAVLLAIIDDDPRVPKFIKRDPSTGEITDVDIDAVRKDRRFGQVLERTLVGWVGRDAPPFTLALLDGTELSSRALAGRSYLLYFWFSGCPPCLKIAPHLVELARRHGGPAFTVVAANADRILELDATDGDRADYLRRAGVTFPVGHLGRRMQEDYGNVNVFPTLFLVDARGVIRKHYVNYQTADVLRRDLEEVLAPQGRGAR